jgi:hypothetical protein
VLLHFGHCVDEMEAIRVRAGRQHCFVLIDLSSRPCSRLIIICKPLPLPTDFSLKPWVVKSDNMLPHFVFDWLENFQKFYCSLHRVLFFRLSRAVGIPLKIPQFSSHGLRQMEIHFCFRHYHLLASLSGCKKWPSRRATSERAVPPNTQSIQ